MDNIHFNAAEALQTMQRLVVRGNVLRSDYQSSVDSYEKLVDKLRSLPFRLSTLLGGIATAAAAIPVDSPHHSVVNSGTLSILMVGAILASDELELTPDGRCVILPPWLLDELCHDALAISSQDRTLIWQPSKRQTADEQDVESLCRIARYQGLPFLLQSQTALVGAFGRFAIMSGYVDFEAGNLKAAPELDSLLAEIYSLSSSELAATLFIIYYYVLGNRDPYIFLPKFVANCRHKARALYHLQNILNQYAITLADARSYLSSSEAHKWVGMTRAYYLFSKRPFIRLGVDYYLIGPHQFLSHILSNSLLKQLREAHGRKYGKQAKRKQSITPSPADRFQIYAVHMLGEAMPEAITYQEQSYHSAWNIQGSGVPDGILINDKKSEAVIVQAKATLFPEGLLGGDTKRTMEIFRETYAESFAQSIRFLERLNDLRRSDNFEHVENTSIRAVAAANRITLISLTPSFLDISFWPIFRKIILREILSLLTPQEAQWLLDRKGSVFFHIDSIETIELYSIRFRHLWLPDMIRQWQFANTAILNKQVNVAFPIPFRNYLEENGGSKKMRYETTASEPFDMHTKRMDEILRTEWGMGN